MQGRSQSGVKRNTTLSQHTKDVITHGTKAIVLWEEDLEKAKDFILNISTDDLVEDMELDMPTLYTEVLDFLKKVSFYYL